MLPIASFIRYVVYCLRVSQSLRTYSATPLNKRQLINLVYMQEHIPDAISIEV